MTKSVMVVADLHLDLWLASGRDPLAALAPGTLSSLDALIIAGDLSNKPKVRWPNILAHIAKYIDLNRVWVLPGNHDYYDHVLDGDKRLATICVDAGANFAQKQIIVVGNTRYLCCTLWTDFALNGSAEIGMRDAAPSMNDYKYIRIAGAGHRRIRPTDIARVHADHRAWLEGSLSEPFAGKTVVITHHAPLTACLPEDYPAAPAYASDLSDMIERYRPQEWLFGHSHVPASLRHGETNLRNVSLGYPDQITEGTEAEVLNRGLLSEEAGE